MPLPEPDADGYVTVTWPSKTIPHGGVFHTRPVDTSIDTRDYIKVLIDEAKQSIRQREKSRWESRLREPDEPIRPPRSRIRAVSLVRPRTSKRRSLSAIHESGAFDADGYYPIKRGENREELKQRLQSIMAYGDSNQQLAPKPRLEKKPPTLPTAKEIRNELLTQIRERVDWLSDMEMLGEGARHRDLIKDQIAERFRAIEALGLESPMSSARSGSGFSTMRSLADVGLRSGSSGSGGGGGSNRSKVSVKTVVKSPELKQQDTDKVVKSTTRKKRYQPVEHVAAYNNYTPLMYSPRRRC